MDANEIFGQVRMLYYRQFKEGDFGPIEEVLTDVVRLFNGEFQGYQACDTQYHDLRHTLEATLIMAEILVGMYKSDLISRELFELGIIAVLLHDSGYIKKEADKQGSGAKYTLRHVERSAEFTGQYLAYLAERGYDKTSIRQVKNMIRCTGLTVDLKKINFGSEEEKKVGSALGSADLLGQMAADNYVEKLPLLFKEFKEAYEYEGGIEKVASQGVKVFFSAEELIEETPAFWQYVLQHRLPLEFGSVFEYLDPAVEKDILARIERNINKIKKK